MSIQEGSTDKETSYATRKSLILDKQVVMKLKEGNSIASQESHENLESKREAQLLQLLQTRSEERKPKHIEKMMQLSANISYFQKNFVSKIHKYPYRKHIHFMCCKLMQYQECGRGEVLIQFGTPAEQCFIILQGSLLVVCPRSDEQVKFEEELYGKVYELYENFVDQESKLAEFTKPKPGQPQQHFQKHRKGKGRQALITEFIYPKLMLEFTPEEREVLSIWHSFQGKRVIYNDNYLKQKLHVGILPLIQSSPQIVESLFALSGVLRFVQVSELGNGIMVGELGLMNNQKRKATLISLDECKFATLNKESYTVALLDLETQVKQKEIDFLYRKYFHKQVDTDKVVVINPYLRKVKILKGQTINVQGKLYIIKKGQVKLVLVQKTKKYKEDEAQSHFNNLQKGAIKGSDQKQLKTEVKSQFQKKHQFIKKYDLFVLSEGQQFGDEPSTSHGISKVIQNHFEKNYNRSIMYKNYLDIVDNSEYSIQYQILDKSITVYEASQVNIRDLCSGYKQIRDFFRKSKAQKMQLLDQRFMSGILMEEQIAEKQLNKQQKIQNRKLFGFMHNSSDKVPDDKKVDPALKKILTKNLEYGQFYREKNLEQVDEQAEMYKGQGFYFRPPHLKRSHLEIKEILDYKVIPYRNRVSVKDQIKHSQQDILQYGIKSLEERKKKENQNKLTKLFSQNFDYKMLVEMAQFCSQNSRNIYERELKKFAKSKYPEIGIGEINEFLRQQLATQEQPGSKQQQNIEISVGNRQLMLNQQDEYEQQNESPQKVTENQNQNTSQQQGQEAQITQRYLLKNSMLNSRRNINQRKVSQPYDNMSQVSQVSQFSSPNYMKQFNSKKVLSANRLERERGSLPNHKNSVMVNPDQIWLQSPRNKDDSIHLFAKSPHSPGLMYSNRPESRYQPDVQFDSFLKVNRLSANKNDSLKLSTILKGQESQPNLLKATQPGKLNQAKRNLSLKRNHLFQINNLEPSMQVPLDGMHSPVFQSYEQSSQLDSSRSKKDKNIDNFSYEMQSFQERQVQEFQEQDQIRKDHKAFMIKKFQIQKLSKLQLASWGPHQQSDRQTEFSSSRLQLEMSPCQSSLNKNLHDQEKGAEVIENKRIRIEGSAQSQDKFKKKSYGFELRKQTAASVINIY